MTPRASVPKLWPGSTIVCIGGGPSLTPADVDACRGRARVIAINDAYKLAPWADVLYACDGKWWGWHKQALKFPGLKFAIDCSSSKYPGVQCLRVEAKLGLSRHPERLCTGDNSGYQAINLAVLLGAQRILLLGYDMARGPKGQSHWFGEHPGGVNGRPPAPSPYHKFLQAFPSLVEPLKQLGVEVVNCTRKTALTVFPQRPLEEMLPAHELQEAAC